jgi:UDP-N-acetylglucosamine/UDP-N-acetylgalactosamine diphosphorylase
VAVHLLAVRFIAEVTREGRARLPLHTARKRCRCWDPATDAFIEIDGVKLEQFVFDALALTERPLVWTVERGEAFAPIKNAAGVDSAESSRALQIERAARWLEAAGVEVPRRADGVVDCVIEIRPGTALEARDLAGVADLPNPLERGGQYVF